MLLNWPVRPIGFLFSCANRKYKIYKMILFVVINFSANIQAITPSGGNARLKWMMNKIVNAWTHHILSWNINWHSLRLSKTFILWCIVVFTLLNLYIICHYPIMFFFTLFSDYRQMSFCGSFNYLFNDRMHNYTFHNLV